VQLIAAWERVRVVQMHISQSFFFVEFLVNFVEVGFRVIHSTYIKTSSKSFSLKLGVQCPHFGIVF
jgi:hypothetical protein